MYALKTQTVPRLNAIHQFIKSTTKARRKKGPSLITNKINDWIRIFSSKYSRNLIKFARFLFGQQKA